MTKAFLVFFLQLAGFKLSVMKKKMVKSWKTLQHSCFHCSEDSATLHNANLGLKIIRRSILREVAHVEDENAFPRFPVRSPSSTCSSVLRQAAELCPCLAELVIETSQVQLVFSSKNLSTYGHAEMVTVRGSVTNNDTRNRFDKRCHTNSPAARSPYGRTRRMVAQSALFQIWNSSLGRSPGNFGSR